MKKGLIIGAVLVVVALALILIALNPLATGNATVTKGANYGPIEKQFTTTSDCVYVSANDGWNVMTLGKVSYFDKLDGQSKTASDNCEARSSVGNMVMERHCEDGYMKQRLVQCPNGMTCSDGICITP